MDLSILNTLGIVDCAIFKRVDEAIFQLEDAGGSWINRLIPDLGVGQPSSIEQNSIFLSDFLIDAESFWSSQQQGQINSGIWTEEIHNTTLYLEATASYVDGTAYLIIRNAEQTFNERRQTLQIARELSLSNSEVVERHDYLSERLRALLTNQSQQSDRLPLIEAIQYASIGIIICDVRLTVLEANDCAFDIFEESKGLNHELLFSKLRDLITRQYPETAVFSGNKSWHGELYWHMPPLVNKWISVNIHPVQSEYARVSHWIISFNDQTRIKHLLQTNEELALHDPLTGLPNRQYFWQQLQQFIKNKQTLSLISIDISNFKFTNELYGYLQGDELLKQISKRLADQLSTHDFITRMGADEFMIIHQRSDKRLLSNEDSTDKQSSDFAEKLMDACAKPYSTNDGRRCELSIKIGIANYPEDANKPEHLLANAALALSQAKLTTNLPIQVYNEELKHVSMRRLMLEEALKGAIDNEQFDIYLQPIYNIRTRTIVKAEALLRWRLNDELVMPGEFIPIAESSDTINIIGRWVIEQVCKIAKQFAQDDIDVPICINFSPNQIYDNALSPFISSVIAKYKVSPSMLELEVTEGVLINNYEKVSKFLVEMKAKGVAVSVDDFGTGYCSLSYLKHLPIDNLKIDRTFIRDLQNSDDDGAIVKAIIALGHNLKLGIIAEGIENKVQEDFLLAHNCMHAQGFLYAKPMPLDDFYAALSKPQKLR